MITLLAGCGSPRAPDSGPPGPGAPELSKGDYWVLAVNVTQGTYAARSNLTMVVASISDAIVSGGITYDAVRIETTQTQKNGLQEWTSVIKFWQRKSDAAQLRANVTTTTHDDGKSNSFETVYDIPCRLYPWPITVGTNMTGECKTHHYVSNSPQTAVTPFSIEVLAYEYVTVPAGTFLAYKMNVTLHVPGSPVITLTRWYSPLACADVRSITSGMGAIETTELTSYQCLRGSPPEPASNTGSA